MKDFYGKKFWKIEKKNFRKNFHDFFFFKNFRLQIFSSAIFFSDIFSILFSIPRWGASVASDGGVGERSEPPAGGLAVGAEGSVNSEFH